MHFPQTAGYLERCRVPARTGRSSSTDRRESFEPDARRLLKRQLHEQPAYQRGELEPVPRESVAIDHVVAFGFGADDKVRVLGHVIDADLGGDHLAICQLGDVPADDRAASNDGLGVDRSPDMVWFYLFRRSMEADLHPGRADDRSSVVIVDSKDGEAAWSESPEISCWAKIDNLLTGGGHPDEPLPEEAVRPGSGGEDDLSAPDPSSALSQ